MYKKIKPLFLMTLTSVHMGSGNELGVVDLPIQREKHTGFPKMESSGVKGALREVYDKNGKKVELGSATSKISDLVFLVFGSKDGGDTAAALGLTDARLLLFPIKSLKNIFAWVTCPYILHRFREEMALARFSNLPDVPNALPAVPEKTPLIVRDDTIVLEEYAISVKERAETSHWAKYFAETLLNGPSLQYWKEKMTKDFVILDDSTFCEFVELSTEVNARIKIDANTGTVATGGLFYEEFLPPETVFYTLVMAGPIMKENEEDKGVFHQEGKREEDLVMDYFSQGLPEVFQLGGDATIGKGFVRPIFIKGGAI